MVSARVERRRRAQIVRYWRAVEMFGPQQVGKVSPGNRMYPVDGGRPLPWERRHPLRAVPLAEGTVWQHTVYCGIYRIAAVRDVLLEVFGENEEDHDARIDGDSALLAFQVTDEGRIIHDSITFSACAWAVGRARSPGPRKDGWLDGFDDEAKACEQIVLDVGDGRLEVMERAAGRLKPFAGLFCEIALGAAGGAVAPLVAPLGRGGAGRCRGGRGAACAG